MDIKKIKSRLNELGFAQLDVTSEDFGNKTIEAIKKFQRANNLDVDGIVGKNTMKALFPNEKDASIADNTKLKPIPDVKGLTLKEAALQIALSQMGVKELNGKNDGEAVEAYLKSVGLGKGYSWCMAFVFWCFNEAAKQLGKANPLIKTGGVKRQWNESPKFRTSVPDRGDVFIMDFGNGNGHTGFVTANKAATIDTAEGNTNNAGSSDGNVATQRSRNKKAPIIGYLSFE